MDYDELKQALEDKNLLFGVKQGVKEFKDGNAAKIFVIKNARQETIDKLQGMPVTMMHSNSDEIENKLRLGFLCEVFTIKGSKNKSKK